MASKSTLRKRLCGKTGTVIWMLSLTSSFFLVEIVVGYATNSMALVADSFHMLSDVMSLIIGFVALRYSKRSQRTDRNTFGWQRAEVLGALINAVFLIALCFSILVESLKRLIEVESIHNPTLVLIVGGVGLVINVIGLAMFHQHGHGHSHGGGGHGHSHKPAINDRLVVVEESDDNDTETKEETEKDSAQASNAESINSAFLPKENGEILENVNENGSLQVHSRSNQKVKSSAQLNMRAVYLHVLGDALGSVIVIISALIIMFAKGKWTLYVDPVMSIFMTCLILRTSIPLMKESSLILLQTVPTHIKIKEVQERLLEGVNGILSVHEFHVWQLAGDKIIASAHITCQTPDDYMKIANQIKRFFHNEGIHSTTIQPEFVEEIHTVKQDKECVLACGEMENCAAQKCCSDDVSDIRKRVSNSTPCTILDPNSLPLQHESVV
ncbi:zinc transporter 1 [Exaiptasia diaphana]|uniref:Zinc transporter 1 n=1 Tax=Exaiptasia diaphana TaxID=2652724 RepID=A0A913XT18_EXADI|nr:zinc transporter 1 [Exaiptasia diaphana]XP_020908748.1 zinc transporter 1 [Exaiptasia diaphana]